MQNHIPQLLAIVAMEPSATFEADAIRDEKAKRLRSARAVDPAEYGPGQYAGCRDDPGVRPDSQTETVAALKIWLDSRRWAGVPFYLRTRNRMAQGATEMVVTSGTRRSELRQSG